MAFDNPLTGGDGALIYPRIKSPDYTPGVDGWSIERDGSAEFNNVVVRGEVYVRSPSTGSYVRIWNQVPGDSAVIEIRPDDSVGTVDAPAYIATGSDSVFGQGGLSISGPSINGSGIPSIIMNSVGMFVEASQGVFWVSSDSGITFASLGDTDFLDLTQTVRAQFRPGSGVFYITDADIGYAEITSGIQPGGALSAVRVFDSFYGPVGGTSITSTSFGNLPNSTGVTFSKGYGATEVKLTLFGRCRTNTGGTQVALAVQINGVDYEVDRHYFDVANIHQQLGGFVSVSGLAAGTYTVRARWRKIGGGGNLTVDDFDHFSLEAREVRG